MLLCPPLKAHECPSISGLSKLRAGSWLAETLQTTHLLDVSNRLGLLLVEHQRRECQVAAGACLWHRDRQPVVHKDRLRGCFGCQKGQQLDTETAQEVTILKLQA